MADWTLKSWQEIPNGAAGWGLADEQMEMRIGREALGLTQHGVSYAKFGKNFVPTWGHRQKQQEETYTVVSGRCIARLGDETVELKAGDVLAVPPHVWRAFRATGGEDAVMIITGAPAVEDDGDIDMEWWPA